MPSDTDFEQDSSARRAPDHEVVDSAGDRRASDREVEDRAGDRRAPDCEVMDRAREGGSQAPDHEVVEIPSGKPAPDHEVADKAFSPPSGSRGRCESASEGRSASRESSRSPDRGRSRARHRKLRRRYDSSSSGERKGRKRFRGPPSSSPEPPPKHKGRRKSRQSPSDSPNPSDPSDARDSSSESERGHRRKSKSRGEVHTSDTSTSDDSDYERFTPHSRKSNKRKWKLQGSAKQYAKEAFQKYIGEEKLEKTIKSDPAPSHVFFKPEELDESIKQGLAKKVGHSQANIALQRDATLQRQQIKVLRVMGPLGKLWQKLDDVRKSGKNRELDLAKALDLAEKAVLLVGQSNVAIRHTRRVEMTHCIMGDLKAARALVKKYDKHCKPPALFGKEFQRKVEDDKLNDNKGLLALRERKQFDHSKQSRENRDAIRPFQGGPPRGKSDRGGHRGGPSGRSGRGRGRGAPPSQKRYVQFKSLVSIPKPSRQPDGLSIMLVNKCKTPQRNRPTRSVPSKHSRWENRGVSRASNSKLVQNHVGQGDSEHGQGLSDSVHRRTAQEQPCLPTKILISGDRAHHRRDTENGGKRGHSAGGTRRRSIPGAHLSQAQEGRFNASNIQPETAEPVDRIQALQNGGPLPVEEFVATGRLDAETGPKGRILLCASEEATQEIPAFQMERQAIRVSVSPVRSGLCSEGFHKADETTDRAATENRGQDDYLSRRPPADEQLPTRLVERWENDVPPAREHGLCGQQGQISHDPDTRPRVSGYDHQLNKDDDEAVRRQDEQDLQPVPRAATPRDSFGKGAVSDDWDLVLDKPGSLTSKTILQRTAEAQNCDAASQEVLCYNDQADYGMQGRVEMVDEPPEAIQWQRNQSPTSRHGDRVGCLPDGLGCNLQWADNTRSLDSSREERPDQHLGAARHPPHSQSFLEGEEQHPCALQSRQCDSSGPYQQNGGHTIENLDRHSERDLGLLPPEEDSNISRTPPRGDECGSGSAVSRRPGLQRLAAGPANISSCDGHIWSLQDGFVCEQMEHATADFCELQAGPRCSGSRCIPNELGQGSTLCFPPILPDNELPGQGTTGQSGIGADNTDLAHPTMVWDDPEYDHSPADLAAHSPEAATFTHRDDTPIGPERLIPPSGVEDFSRRQEARGLSRESANLITKSWRAGSRMAYNSAWRKWACWCSEKKVDPFQAPVELVVDYLTDLYQKQYAYSTINGARSAISALHAPIDGTPVGQHGLVKRLMAGVFNERTPMPRYTDTWEVKVVLDYIRGLGANKDLSDKDLSHKLAMLLALTTASRASEIQGLDLAFMTDDGSHITFAIAKLTKTRRVGEKPRDIILHQYEEDPLLDVVECIRAYILRTRSWRLTEAHHRLLLGIVNPHNPVCTSTISNWLKHLMDAAGIDVSTYKGHSTRAAATSKARAGGISVAEIVKRANWKRASTFQRFYNKAMPCQTDDFAQAVLK